MYTQVVKVYGEIELAAPAVRVTGTPSVPLAVFTSLLLQHQHRPEVALQPNIIYNEEEE